MLARPSVTRSPLSRDLRPSKRPDKKRHAWRAWDSRDKHSNAHHNGSGQAWDNVRGWESQEPRPATQLRHVHSGMVCSGERRSARSEDVQRRLWHVR